MVAGAVVAAVVVVSNRTGNVSHPNVEFTATTPAPKPPSLDKFIWPVYGYDKQRTRYLPASPQLHPPFQQRWVVGSTVLTEFPPVIAHASLYWLKNNGALYAISKESGKPRWKRKVGLLAASSPAYAHGRVFVVLLRGRTNAGTVTALSGTDGRRLWTRTLPSRAESSPLFDRGTLYFGTQNGTVYALRATDGVVRWTYHASGAVKGGPALYNGNLYFGDYGGKVHAVRASDGHEVWSVGTSGAHLGFGSGQFYSTPAVAFGRVYLGNTDGNVYSFAESNGKLAWRTGTGGYVYASPAVAQVAGTPPTVYIGSYSGRFYALDAQTGKVRWTHNAGGKISGSATVLGDIVYYSNLSNRTTTGLGVRTGLPVFSFPRGAFNPDRLRRAGHLPDRLLGSVRAASRPKSAVAAAKPRATKHRAKRRKRHR